MAITYVGSVENERSSTVLTSVTFSAATGTRTNGFLAVMVSVLGVSGSGGDVTNITWNGNALTPTTQSGSIPTTTEVWYKLSPEGGTHDIVVSFSGTGGNGPTQWEIVAVWCDSDNVIELGNTNIRSVTTEDPTTITVDTVTAAEMVLFGYATQDNNVATTSETLVLDYDSGGNCGGLARYTAGAAGTQTGHWNRSGTGQSSVFEMTAVCFKEAGVGDPPDVVIDTADETAFTTDQPTILFTGTDPDADDITYNIQIADNSTFQTGVILKDNYDTGGSKGGLDMHLNPLAFLTWQGNYQLDDRAGQSFVGNGGVLDKIAFRFNSDSANTAGYAVVRVYAHQGTYGTDSAPNDPASFDDTPTTGWLAISDQNDYDGTQSINWYDFNFTGDNRIRLVDGTHYVCVIDWIPDNSTSNNYLDIYGDAVVVSHGGNSYDDGAQEANNGPHDEWDMFFRVYEAFSILDKVSDTDTGFINEDDGGDTDPFTSGDQVSYTVQSGDALPEGTYWVRVRGIDPDDTNSYGDWSTAISFTITLGTDISDTQPIYFKGKDTNTDTQVIYLKGKDTSTDNQPIYMKGAISVVDTQPIYLKGLATITDNQPIFTQGKDSSTNNQPIYMLGVAGAVDISDTQTIYLKGQASIVDTQTIYLKGKDSLADTQAIYLKGRDFSTDSQPIYLKGKSSALDNQPIYTRSVTWPFFEPFTGSDNDDWSNQRWFNIIEEVANSVYIEGNEGILYSPNSTSGGSAIAGVDNKKDYYVKVTARLETTSTTGLYFLSITSKLVGNLVNASPETTGVSFGLLYDLDVDEVSYSYYNIENGISLGGGNGSLGIPASSIVTIEGWTYGDWLNIRITSGSFTTSYRQALPGTLDTAVGGVGIGINPIFTDATGKLILDNITIAYPSDFFTQPIYLKGSINITDTQPIYLKGKSTSTNNQPIFLSGSITVSDTQSIYLNAIGVITDTQPIFMVGASGGNDVSDNQPIYLKGIDTFLDNQSIYLRGQLSLADTQIIYLRGSATSTDTQTIYLSGKADLTDTQIIYLKGRDSQTDTQTIFIKGRSTAIDSQSIFLAGRVEVTDTQSIYLFGTGNVVTDNQPIYFKGIDTLSDNQTIFLRGKLTLSNTQPIFLTGIIGFTDTQPIFLRGSSSAIDDQVIYLRGRLPISKTQSIYLEGILGITDSLSIYMRGVSALPDFTRRVHIIGKRKYTVYLEGKRISYIYLDGNVEIY